MKEHYLPGFLGAILAVFGLGIGGCAGPFHHTSCHAQYVDLGPGRPCSAVAVGPHVALTAAHCLDGGSPPEITLLPKGGGTRTGHCYPFPYPDPDDPSNEWVDLAICVFDDEFPADEIETISTDRTQLGSGSRVTFAGFGCNQGACGDAAEGCSAEGPRRGRGRVPRKSASEDTTLLSTGRSLGGRVNVSPGDSGGPVCSRTGDRLVGVIRAGCVNGKKWKALATALAAEETVEWMCAWHREYPTERRIKGLVCG